MQRTGVTRALFGKTKPVTGKRRLRSLSFWVWLALVTSVSWLIIVAAYDEYGSREIDWMAFWIFAIPVGVLLTWQIAPDSPKHEIDTAPKPISISVPSAYGEWVRNVRVNYKHWSEIELAKESGLGVLLIRQLESGEVQDVDPTIRARIEGALRG